MIRKEFASEIKDIDLAAQELTMVVSTEAVDREGDIIEAAGWELGAYRKNPVVLFGHQYNQPAVGRAGWIDVMDKALVARVQFAPTPFGQELWMLYSQGYMRASSVGFIPKDTEPIEEPDEEGAEEQGSGGAREQGGKGAREQGSSPASGICEGAEEKGFWGPTRFKRQELLEFSLVPVPANPEALVAAKAAGLEVGIVERAMGGASQRVSESANEPRKRDLRRVSESAPEAGSVTSQPRERQRDLRRMTAASGAGGTSAVPAFVEGEALPFSDLPVEGGLTIRRTEVGTVPGAREVSQGELGDEMAYLVEVVGRVGVSEGMAPLARGLAELLRRETGGDTASESIRADPAEASGAGEQGGRGAREQGGGGNGDLSRIVMEMVRDEIVRWSRQVAD